MKDKTTLGSWCTNACCKFIDDKHIQIEFVAHTWYAYDNDSKTDVISKKVCFVKEVNFDANDEIEILEEDKKIEKLNKKHFHKKQRQLANKINELIDEVTKLKENKDE